MPRRQKRDKSWLLDLRPPLKWTNKKPIQGPAALWWAVIRTAGYDLRYGDRIIAQDGLAFLRVSGLLLIEVLGLPIQAYKQEVVSLVRRSCLNSDAL